MNDDQSLAMADRLYADVLSSVDYELSAEQQQNFKFACLKSIVENPQLEMAGWRISAKVYLNFIVDFPQMTLPPIKEPR